MQARPWRESACATVLVVVSLLQKKTPGVGRASLQQVRRSQGVTVNTTGAAAFGVTGSLLWTQ